MSSYSLVPCAEEHLSISENIDVEGGINAQVTLRCDWEDRFALMQDILTVSKDYPQSGFNVNPQAYACACRPAEGKATSVGQINYYEYALVTVSYSTKIKDLVSESIEPTVEFLTLDHKRFRWGAADGDVLLEGEAPGMQMRGMNIVRTLYAIQQVPAAVLTSMGKSNDAAYTSQLLGLTFDTETLLYHPPNLSRVITSAGTEGFTLTMKFQYKPETWNKYWRAKTQTYEKIYLAGGAEYKNFPPADFSSLLY